MTTLAPPRPDLQAPFDEPLGVLRAVDVSQAADAQSTKSPGKGDQTVSGAQWELPENIKSSDNKRASVVLGGSPIESSSYLRATNFAFALPEEATVLGVLAAVERAASGTVSEASVLLTFNGVEKGTSHHSPIPWATTEAYAQYGGSGDLWGRVLTPLDVNDTTFGLALRVLGGPGTAEVDHVKLTVYYTEADDENRVCFATRGVEPRTDGVFRQHPTDDVWGQLVPEGFLPYASPSGLEGRESRFIVVPTSGDLGTLPDGGDNPLSAQVFTRSAYHVAREAAEK